MGDVVIIGCGDMGRRIAAVFQENGATVTAVARSEEKLATLATLGIRSIAADLDDQASLVELPLKGTIVYYLAPPPGGGHIDSRMRNFCASVRQGNEPQRVIYMSTSGVYGDCGDALVTEETPANPQTPRAKRRFDAETVLTVWGNAQGVEVIILRVTGIYGPGRLPVTQLAGGQPLLFEHLSPPTNRIHSEDLVQVCVAAAEKGENGDIFNVSDGRPGTMTEYFTKAADLLGYPRPRQVSLEEARRVMSPLMLSYISETRRMDNSKMLQKLGITLRYPTLEEGLKASL